MQVIRLNIPGEPVGKGRPRFTRSGHAYTPDTTKQYEALCKKKFVESKMKMIEGPVSVFITAYYGIPKSTSKKRTDCMLCGDILPRKKPDVDNVAKIILDALNGLAFEDDKDVCELQITKEYSDEPRVEVEIQKIFEVVL